MVFFFNDTATTEIYTLSLHDALPICGAEQRVLGAPRHPPADVEGQRRPVHPRRRQRVARAGRERAGAAEDRKSTRLNSSHANISYAVFCLKKKKHHVRWKRRTILDRS